MQDPDTPLDFVTGQDEMDSTTSSLKVWNDVPDNTILELRLEPEGGAFVGRAVLAIQGVEEEQWPDEEIHPGPKRRILDAEDRRYSVNVFVGFAGGQETAILTAVLLDESGNLIREPFIHPMTGQNNETRTAAIFINMV